MPSLREAFFAPKQSGFIKQIASAAFGLLAMTITTFPLFADETVATAIHVHSSISSGAQGISEIAAIAHKQQVEAVILTDHYDERYEYGFWIFKKVVEREAIRRSGFQKYLAQIREAAARHLDVLLIDGTAVTPFYYWTGSLWSGQLTLNNRARDLLVLGLGDAEKYQRLPVIHNHRLKFSPYAKDPFYAPYQKFIEEASEMGGLVFWSHPYAQENYRFENMFLGFDLILQTHSYAESLLETKGYTGFGVYAGELTQIQDAAADTTVFPGREWDRVLRQHGRGQREQPAWAIGEVDYNGFPGGIQNVDGILNMVLVPEKSQKSILKSLSEGKSYVIIPSSHTKRLLLEEYAVLDMTTQQKAAWSGELEAEGVPTLRLHARFSDDSEGTLQILLIRNGQIIQQWTKIVPFTLDYQDWENTSPGKSYYRVMAYSEESPDRLLTNPIFVNQKS